jgi:hypothetical protein
MQISPCASISSHPTVLDVARRRIELRRAYTGQITQLPVLPCGRHQIEPLTNISPRLITGFELYITLSTVTAVTMDGMKCSRRSKIGSGSIRDTQEYWNERAGGMSGPGARWPRQGHKARCFGPNWGKCEIGASWWAIGGMVWWLGCLTTLWTRRHAQFIGSGGVGVWIGVGAVAAGEGRGHWCKSCVSFMVAGSPVTSQWYRAAYVDVVKPHGTWHPIDGRPTPVTYLSRPQSKRGTTASRNSVHNSIAVKIFLPRGVVRA